MNHKYISINQKTNPTYKKQQINISIILYSMKVSSWKQQPLL